MFKLVTPPPAVVRLQAYAVPTTTWSRGHLTDGSEIAKEADDANTELVDRAAMTQRTTERGVLR